MFTSTALAKQFATRHVSNRHGVTVLFNMPYAAQFMEQGLTSAFTNANVFTIDGAAISRIFETSLEIVLSETLSFFLKSPSSELTHYIKENGLVTLNIPKSKVSSLPPLSKSDESNTFKATPYTRRNLDLRPKKHARVLTENEVLTSSVAPKQLDVVKTLKKSLQDSQERSNDLTIVRRTFSCYHENFYQRSNTNTGTERDLAHIELVHTKHDVDYKPGHILRVKPRNDSKRVETFLKQMKWNGDDLVVFGENDRVLTVREHATSILELFACPKSSFLKTSCRSGLVLSSTTSTQVSCRQHRYGQRSRSYERERERERENVKDFDYADLIHSQLVPEIAERSYSIASCRDVVGSRQVDLIVVRETWDTIEGEHRAGLCSSFLCDVPRERSRASIDTSTSLDLTDSSKDIIMIGFGTGIAPLRAFCQWYYHLRRQGKRTGEIILYFGARTSSNENMYGFELSSMLRGMSTKTGGPIRMLRQAFSRDDPKKKVYVQHLMNEDRDTIREFLVERKAGLVLCGPTRPVDSACDVVSDVTRCEYGGSGK